MTVTSRIRHDDHAALHKAARRIRDEAARDNEGSTYPFSRFNPGRDPASAVPIPTATCCRVCGPPPPPPAPPPHVVPGRARLRVNAPPTLGYKGWLSPSPTTVRTTTTRERYPLPPHSTHPREPIDDSLAGRKLLSPTSSREPELLDCSDSPRENQPTSPTSTT